MKKITLLFVLFTFSSCALKPIKSDYNHVKIEKDDLKLDQLGNGKILIYNGSDILHKADNTERLNVWIQEKALGQLRGNEYTVINLEEGVYNFRVQHIDLVNMRSDHKVVVNDTVKIIRIEPTIFSNKLTITNKFPKRFDKFNYAKERE